jgi:hypothetical protein
VPQKTNLGSEVDSNVVSSLISSEQITSIATQNRNILMLIEDAMAVSSRPRFALIPSAEVEVSAPTRDGKVTSRPGWQGCARVRWMAFFPHAPLQSQLTFPQIPRGMQIRAVTEFAPQRFSTRLGRSSSPAGGGYEQASGFVRRNTPRCALSSGEPRPLHARCPLPWR